MSRGLRVLGLDPGSVRTGWCVIEGLASRGRVDGAGVVRCPRDEAFADRLHRLYAALVEVVRERAPDVAAVESPFHGVSARSSLQLAQARGAILAAVAGAGLPVVEYSPATVKKSITGDGRADKDRVRRMTVRLVGLDLPGAPDDLYDAAAVAWCHLGHAPLEAALRRTTARAAASTRRTVR